MLMENEILGLFHSDKGACHFDRGKNECEYEYGIHSLHVPSPNTNCNTKT